MLSNFIHQILPSPEMVEQEKKSVIRTLQTIVVVSMVSTVVSFLVVSFSGTIQARVIMAGLFLLLAISLYALRRGILLPAQLLTPTALFATVTYLVIYGNGLHDAAFLGFAGVIIVASLTLGQGAAFVFAGMVIITSWAIGFAELNGSLVSPGSGLTDESTPVYITILVLAITFTQRTLINRMNENLQRAHKSEALAKRELAERKQTEEALRESGERLQLFFNQSLAGFFFSMIDNPIEWNGSVDKENVLDYVLDNQCITEANDAIVEQYGATREGFLGRTTRDFFAHDLVEGRQFCKKLFDQGRLHISTDERKDDGTPMWIGGDYVCLYDKQGHITGIFGIQRDITERKRAEDELRESEERFRSLFDRTMDGVYRSTHAGKFVDINPAMVKMFGYSSKEEMLEVDIKNELYFAPEERGSRVLDTGQEEIDVYRMRRKDSSEIWVEDHGSYVHDAQGEIIYHEGMLRDITERKRAEQEIRENEQRYRALFEQSNDAIAIMSLDRTLLAINQIRAGLLGYSMEEVINKDALQNTSPTDFDDARRKFEQVVAGEKLPIYERAFIRKDGSTLITEINLSLIRDTSGKPWLVQSIIRDITERKRAEEALRQSEQRLRMVLDNLGEGVLVQDSEWRYTYANPAAHAIVGWPSGTLVGATEDAILLPASQTLGKQHNTLRVTGEISSYETQLVRPNGEVRTIIAAGVPRLDEHGILVETFVAFTDITERKQAEEELQHARQRLISAVEEERRRLRRDLHDGLGPALASQGLKLAAAKQLLNYDPASARPLLDQVMAQIQETVGDVRHLVYSLRPPALDERGLAEAIRDHVLHGELGSLHVEVGELPSGLPPLPAAVEVAVYRIALEALTNVIRHARAKHCTIQFALKGNKSTNILQIEVVDDGTGLPRKLRAGVGLRSMRERAEELGGTLTVEPVPRGGTRIAAMLPLGDNTNSRDFDQIASADYP